MKNRYLESKAKLTEKLSTVDSVCTTVDCWSARGKSFLGVTCHWLDSKTFERQSICLSIQRVFGKHSYDVLAKELEAIHTEFGIQDKTIVTITDSGSNFLKAFRLFGTKPSSLNISEDEDDSLFKSEDQSLELVIQINFPLTKQHLILLSSFKERS